MKRHTKKHGIHSNQKYSLSLPKNKEKKKIKSKAKRVSFKSSARMNHYNANHLG